MNDSQKHSPNQHTPSTDEQGLIHQLTEENTELRRQVEELRQMAHTDSLTKVLNRAGLELLLEDRFKEFVRLRHDPEGTLPAFTLLCIDMDNFKGINDNYGHLAGDEALRIVADSLASRLRSNDIIGRYGGDEFVIGLIGANRDDAMQLAGELVELVRGDLVRLVNERESNQTVEDDRYGISVGVATLNEHNHWRELFNEADQALDSTKKSGKGHVQAFNSSGK